MKLPKGVRVAFLTWPAPLQVSQDSNSPSSAPVPSQASQCSGFLILISFLVPNAASSKVIFKETLKSLPFCFRWRLPPPPNIASKIDPENKSSNCEASKPRKISSEEYLCWNPSLPN